MNCQCIGAENIKRKTVFLFTSSVQPMVNTHSGSSPPDDQAGVRNLACHSAYVWAVHETGRNPKTLHAVLAPKHERGALNDKWNVDGTYLMRRLKQGENIFFCVPTSPGNHLPLDDNTLW